MFDAENRVRQAKRFLRLGQDLRYGWRTLGKNPLFGTTAVLSLALGIGANTAIYSLMDATLTRALPVRNPGGTAIDTRIYWADMMGRLAPGITLARD